MRSRCAMTRVRFYIGDVRDYDSVDRATRGVDFVFHAAALKQVPSCEFFPLEAVRTNVVGSANVIEAANANGVRPWWSASSTDKAVYPVNAMGMSKALMEKVALRRSPATTRGPATAGLARALRQRDVLARLGDPALRRAGPGRPADDGDRPGMTRFLMSLAESVDLVEHAFTHAQPGDLFIRKAPRQHGRRPGHGRRPACSAWSRARADRHPARREAATRPWPPARSWRAPRTWATTSGSRWTRATSTTPSTSTRATRTGTRTATTPRRTRRAWTCRRSWSSCSRCLRSRAQLDPAVGA